MTGRRRPSWLLRSRRERGPTGGARGRNRPRLRGWIVSSLVVALFAALVFRGNGISARRTPWPGEVGLATALWRFMVPTGMRRAPNPVPNTPEILNAALEHFADHCATCHANDGSGDTAIGRNLFPRAPDMRQPGTQALTDGEIFYAIEQGIPWTGMPAWATNTAEGQRQSWGLVRFIRRLPLLTPDELSRMEQFNPRSPATEARDREIEEFLKGTGSPDRPEDGSRAKSKPSPMYPE